jgi:mono/diheme cytochrome c family protein
MAWAAGSAKNGKAIAQQQCSNCHLIDKNGNNAIESQPAGPDFMSIKGLNAATLKARLKSPHPVMSKFPDLSDQQIADLVTYIGSVSR